MGGDPTGQWRWRTDTGIGDLPSFPTQADAEAWLGEAFADLVEAGAGAVTLLDGERVVYGPMSLSQ